MPDLFIITGSNGAGKSSVGPSYLPSDIQATGVFDGDKLFTAQLRKLFPHKTKSPKEARKLAYLWLTKKFDDLVQEALRT